MIVYNLKTMTATILSIVKIIKALKMKIRMIFHMKILKMSYNKQIISLCRKEDNLIRSPYIQTKDYTYD